MSLNKQGPGKIDWTDYSWNPIAGCLHDCGYCYMKRMKRYNPEIMVPVYRPEFVAKERKRFEVIEPSQSFVGSSGDMWGKWVLSEHIEIILQVVRDFPQHTFQFLTKNPERYSEFDLPLGNAWYGTTVDGTARTEQNLFYLNIAAPFADTKRFVSYEPLLHMVEPDLYGIRWVIIGGDTNNGAAKVPQEWAERIMCNAMQRDIAVWLKDGLKYPDRIKEWPK